MIHFNILAWWSLYPLPVPVASDQSLGPLGFRTKLAGKWAVIPPQKIELSYCSFLVLYIYGVVDYLW